jgi:hypothetical protein
MGGPAVRRDVMPPLRGADLFLGRVPGLRLSWAIFIWPLRGQSA